MKNVKKLKLLIMPFVSVSLMCSLSFHRGVSAMEQYQEGNDDILTLDGDALTSNDNDNNLLSISENREGGFYKDKINQLQKQEQHLVSKFNLSHYDNDKHNTLLNKKIKPKLSKEQRAERINSQKQPNKLHKVSRPSELKSSGFQKFEVGKGTYGEFEVPRIPLKTVNNILNIKEENVPRGSYSKHKEKVDKILELGAALHKCGFLTKKNFSKGIAAGLKLKHIENIINKLRVLLDEVKCVQYKLNDDRWGSLFSFKGKEFVDLNYEEKEFTRKCAFKKMQSYANFIQQFLNNLNAYLSPFGVKTKGSFGRLARNSCIGVLKTCRSEKYKQFEDVVNAALNILKEFMANNSDLD